MDAARPSRTALAAASHRAAHQVLEEGRIFRDPLALRILGDSAGAAVERDREQPDTRGMRIFLAARSRFAEDTLATAVDTGVRQAVILGAGLDTSAYRSPYGERVRFFEVDHPATQGWKRELLARAGIPEPASLAFVPVDLERESLPDCLAKAGFDTGFPTFFAWLGVVPYLSEEAVWSTLGFVAGVHDRSHVVFDYSDPPESLDPEARARHEARAARVAGIGEAFVTHFEPDELRAGLEALGFARVDDLGPQQIAARYFPGRGSRSERGGHVVHAATRGVSALSPDPAAVETST